MVFCVRKAGQTWLVHILDVAGVATHVRPAAGAYRYVIAKSQQVVHILLHFLAVVIKHVWSSTLEVLDNSVHRQGSSIFLLITIFLISLHPAEDFSGDIRITQNM